MTGQTNDRCPLCEGEGTTHYHSDPDNEYCLNPNCNLSVRKWPRIRDLVAIRDAVLQWREMCELDAPGTAQEIWAQEEHIMDLARQEAEHGRPREKPETPAD